MFKGTNKFWKGLALLLVLCMLPTVALASETNTITVEGDWVKVNEEGSNVTVTVTGSISDAEADVTILAVRDAGEVTLATVGTWSDEILKSKVVYIDQESFDDGNFEFNFIPKSGVKGGKLTVFVGGENVNEVKSKSEDAAVTAPDVVPVTPWYQGAPLQLNIYKAGTTEAYGDEAAVKGWFDDINSFTVNGGTPLATAGEGAPVTRLGNVITVTGVTATEQAPLTAIAITTNANSYKEETWEGSVKQDPKPAGTFTADKATITAGTAATFTVAESSMGGWLEAVDANVYIDGVKAGDGLATLSGTTLSVTLPELGNTAESKEYTVTIEVANYAVASAKVTAVAPTKLAKEAINSAVKALTAANKEGDPQYEAIPEADQGDDATLKDQKYGKRYVDVSTIETPVDLGVSVDWAWEPTVIGDGPVYELPRSDADKVTYTLTGTIKKTGYTDAVVTTTFTVGQLGVAGVTATVATTFIDPRAAATAEVTIDGQRMNYVSEQNFTLDNVVPGAYRLAIIRAGYTSLEMDVTVNDDGRITETIPEMFVGDINDDGTVNINDYSPLALAWSHSVLDEEDLKSDLNGDNMVNINDYSPLALNWGESATYYVAPTE